MADESELQLFPRSGMTQVGLQCKEKCDNAHALPLPTRELALMVNRIVGYDS